MTALVLAGALGAVLQVSGPEAPSLAVGVALSTRVGDVAQVELAPSQGAYVVRLEVLANGALEARLAAPDGAELGRWVDLGDAGEGALAQTARVAAVVVEGRLRRHLLRLSLRAADEEARRRAEEAFEERWAQYKKRRVLVRTREISIHGRSPFSSPAGAAYLGTVSSPSLGEHDTPLSWSELYERAGRPDLEAGAERREGLRVGLAYGGFGLGLGLMGYGAYRLFDDIGNARLQGTPKGTLVLIGIGAIVGLAGPLAAAQVDTRATTPEEAQSVIDEHNRRLRRELELEEAPGASPVSLALGITW